jgi:segregation and condensation protein A
MISVKIDAFEGPLDLLLHLINKAEVNIYDISVSEITGQYVDYIHAMQELELDVASEYLVMAAHLLAIKSRMLLPKEEEYAFQPELEMDVEATDPRQELIERLIEYKKFKSIADQLRHKETEQSRVFTRQAEDLSTYIAPQDPNPVQDVSLYDLVDAFQQAIQEEAEEPYAKVEREQISIDDRMQDITEQLRKAGSLTFRRLLSEQAPVSEGSTKQSKRKSKDETGKAGISKDKIVVTFMAILELMKNSSIRCWQDRLFGDIRITLSTEEDRYDKSTTDEQA